MNDSTLLDSGSIPTQIMPVSQGTRFGNYILDSIALYIISIPVKYLPFMVAAQQRMQETIKEAAANKDFGAIFAASWDVMKLSIPIGIAIGIIYFAVMEFSFGKTLGKMITKTKVVMADGSKPTFGTIFIRTLCRHIPFEPFSFLGGPVGWHDSISKTRVVSDKPIVGVGY